MQRSVDRRLRRLLAGDLTQARADLLECERVVSEQPGVLVHERLRRLAGLAISLDRSAFAVACHAVVPQRDLQDVRVVGGLARDDEGLGELQPDDAGLDLHARSLRRRARGGVPN